MLLLPTFFLNCFVLIYNYSACFMFYNHNAKCNPAQKKWSQTMNLSLISRLYRWRRIKRIKPEQNNGIPKHQRDHRCWNKQHAVSWVRCGDLLHKASSHHQELKQPLYSEQVNRAKPVSCPCQYLNTNQSIFGQILTELIPLSLTSWLVSDWYRAEERRRRRGEGMTAFSLTAKALR